MPSTNSAMSAHPGRNSLGTGMLSTISWLEALNRRPHCGHFPQFHIGAALCSPKSIGAPSRTIIPPDGIRIQGPASSTMSSWRSHDQQNPSITFAHLDAGFMRLDTGFTRSRLHRRGEQARPALWTRASACQTLRARRSACRDDASCRVSLRS